VCAVRVSTSVSFGVEGNYSVPVSIGSVLFELRCPAHSLPSNQRKETLMDGWAYFDEHFEYIGDWSVDPIFHRIPCRKQASLKGLCIDNS